MAEAGLTTTYVAALIASGTVALGVGVWAYVTSDVPERRLFLGLMIVDTAWVGSAAVGLLTRDPTATWILLHVKAILAITAASSWYVFATMYTDRPLRDWRTAAVVGPLGVAALLIATNPIHHLHWSSVTYQSDPLSFVATTATLAVPVVHFWVFLAIGIGIYYVGELFVKSRHRTSLSMLVLVGGAVSASLPNVASNLSMVPVAEYDHTVFGVIAFVVAAGYAIFGLGMFDIRPIARDNLLDEVDDALLVLDEEGLLVDYNAASRTLFAGVDDGDPIGKPLSTVCPTVAGAIELPSAGESRTTDVASITRDGEQIHYSGQVTSIAENDETVGYSVVLRDVTAQVEYRRELERRNEQLDRFASAVAHDLRNPLQVAYGRASMLESTVPDTVEVNGELTASVAAITESLERMDDIIRDLRALAEKGQSVETVSTVAFEDVVRDAWETTATDDATLVIDATGTIEADRSHLLSIFENLFRNGIEHVDTTVTIYVGLTETGFYVADDGPGIPEDDHEQIFSYGYTSGDDGSGLGLAIVETMVAAHGWAIEATESEHGGASFVVSDATIELATTPE